MYINPVSPSKADPSTVMIAHIFVDPIVRCSSAGAKIGESAPIHRRDVSHHSVPDLEHEGYELCLLVRQADTRASTASNTSTLRC